MILTKEEAIEFCAEKGKKFMKLFHELYKKSSKINFTSITLTMDILYHEVSSVKIGSKGKDSKGNSITHNQLRDWFFDANSEDEFFISDYKELNLYDKLINMVLSGNYKNMTSVYETLVNNRGQMLYAK